MVGRPRHALIGAVAVLMVCSPPIVMPLNPSSVVAVERRHPVAARAASATPHRSVTVADPFLHATSGAQAVSGSSRFAIQPGQSLRGGRAVAVRAHTALTGTIAVADTGEVLSDRPTRAEQRVLSFPGPLLVGTVANGVVVTGAESANASASLEDLRIELLGPGLDLLTITLRSLSATARSGCSEGSTASSRLAFLAIGPLVLVSTEVAVPPNTAIEVPTLGILPRIAVTLNEQIAVSTPESTNISVSAVHVLIGGIVDVLVGHASSRAQGCSTPPPPESHLQIDPAVVREGRVVVAVGSRFPASSRVTLDFGPVVGPAAQIEPGTKLETQEGTTTPEGTFRMLVLVPHDHPLGPRRATASSGTKTASSEFLVVRPTDQPPFSTVEGRL